MKKLSYGLLALSLCVIFLALPTSNSIVSAQEIPGKKLQTEANLVDYIKRFANRSSEGLVEKTNSDGSVSVDLNGRFQYLMLAKLNSHGSPVGGCITNLIEANNFLEKNLETGEYLYNSTSTILDGIETQANQHGMSAKEFQFYTNLIKEAEARRALSPNSATISIINADSPGEGFNDSTPVSPEGGNNGATLGAQRLNVFNAAAALWGSFIDSNVEIQVEANFDPLFCSATSVALGGASTTTVHRNFPNADRASTWYHQAVANKQAGIDLSGNPDLRARFNSDLNGNPNCFGGRRFYLGLNNSAPSGTSNLFIVVLHEIAHGLGFSDFVDADTGALFNGFPDVFTSNMYDRTTMKFWNDMTNAERATSAVNRNNVLWDGSNVKVASGNLTNARDAAGRVELFTPNPVDPGSSISHWNTTVTPNLLMEPFINLDLPVGLDLSPQQLRDVGWFRDTNTDAVPDTITNVSPTGGTLVIGTQATIGWNNGGGFNRNVTIELSTNGGNTYPTVLATNLPNTGSFTFTVPNTPTTQAKVRVREFDFAAPSGQSSSSFSISTTAAPSKAIFDFEGDGKTDIGIFRPGPGEWWYLRSSDNQSVAFQFGAGSDTITPADYTGDGKTDIALFRPSSGEWFVLRSEDNSFYAFSFGQTGDIPVPGDFDGDNKADPAVFRPSSGTWFIINSTNGSVTITPFGAPGDLPIVKDYDGDNKADIAVYRPSVSEWYLNRSSAGFVGFQFGANGDRAVPADYTGDGKADIAFYRPSTGFWFVLRSEDASFFAFPFGASTDIPVPGDYDGDGKADAAVFRPSNNTWFLQQSTAGSAAVAFGVQNDIPVPSAYIR